MLDKPEWKLLGQQLTITLPITDPVSYIIVVVKLVYVSILIYSNGFMQFFIALTSFKSLSVYTNAYIIIMALIVYIVVQFHTISL